MTEALNPELVMQLRVNAARMVASDIREFEFVDPSGAELPEFTPGSHVPRLGFGEESNTKGGMVGAKPHRNQHFYGLPKQFRSVVSEKPLGIVIEQYNSPAGIDHYHRHGRRLNDLTQ